MLSRLKTALFGDPYRSLSLIVRLLRENGPVHWRSYAFVIFCMIVNAACTAATAYLVGTAVNQAYVNRSLAGIVTVAVAVIVIFTTKGLSSYGQVVVLAKIANRINAENQRRLFDALLKQELSYFGDRHSSEFISRIVWSSGSAAEVLRIVVTTIGRDAMTLTGLVAVMIIQAPVLSLIGLLAMTPSFLFVRHLIRRVRNISLNEFAGTARIAESLQETFQGLRVVKALNLEDEMRRRVDEDTRGVEQAANKLARVKNRSAPLMESLSGLAVGLVLIYGAYQVLVLNALPGEFVSFIAAFLLAYDPGKRIARLNVDLSASIVGVEMLYQTLDTLQKADNTLLPDLHVTKGQIEFKDVVFEYRPLVPVLRGLSFVAEPEQVTALVGPSGGGKTTIFNLLLRFYDANSGVVSIDGQNITSVSQTSMRNNIAYVGQDIYLFHGSIRANIALGRLGASEDEIVAAAKAAHAHDFIMEFPAGYDTAVGEHGLQLSGGQRQRIAIARAMIRNASIILLDEPTASLDAESELHVQMAIKRLAQGRTMLVIAHRLHTIRDAHMIRVVEDGRIVESGRHNDLLRRGGRYADVYRLQFERSATPAARDAILEENQSVA